MSLESRGGGQTGRRFPEIARAGRSADAGRGVAMAIWRLTCWLRVGLLIATGLLLICGPAAPASVWHDRGQALHRVRSATQERRM